jgi:hypothetical protein
MTNIPIIEKAQKRHSGCFSVFVHPKWSQSSIVKYQFRYDSILNILLTQFTFNLNKRLSVSNSFYCIFIGLLIILISLVDLFSIHVSVLTSTSCLGGTDACLSSIHQPYGASFC